MKISFAQNNNISKINFGATLNFSDTTSIFNGQERDELKKMFENDTQKNSGEFIVKRDDSLVAPPYYRFIYKNGNHIDYFSGYVSSRMPSGVSGFCDKLEQFFDVFLRRERALEQIKKMTDDFHKNSSNSLSRVAEMKAANLKKFDLEG